jgi:hypothetical protein
MIQSKLIVIQREIARISMRSAVSPPALEPGLANPYLERWRVLL